MPSTNASIRMPPHWPRLLDAVEKPESILAWSSSAEGWNKFLTDLWGNGLFPHAFRAWRKEGVLDRLPESARMNAEARMTAYRAGSAVSWTEIDNLLALFCEEGLHPVPLKGTHLAIRYYPNVHLRPISDLDVLFKDLQEADEAFDLLAERGYRFEDEGIQGDHWDMSHQRTALEHPRSAFHVEVHGSLIYAPRDKRWKGGAEKLIEDLDFYDYRGLKLRGLNREANVVFLCAHTFMQHAVTPARALLYYDLKFLLAKSGEEFNWEKMCSLAKLGWVEAHVAQAMRILKEQGIQQVPGEVFKLIGGTVDEAGLSPGAVIARKSVQQITHASGPWTALKMAWNITIPKRSFLRVRYPEKSSWPVFLLYPYRWWKQAGKIAQWLFGRKSGA